MRPRDFAPRPRYWLRVMDSDSRVRSSLIHHLIGCEVVLTVASLAETSLNASGPLHGANAAIGTRNLIKDDRTNIGGSLSENAGALVYLPRADKTRLTAKENLSTAKGASRKNYATSLGSELDGTGITAASEGLDLKSGNVAGGANDTVDLGVGPVLEVLPRVGRDEIGSKGTPTFTSGEHEGWVGISAVLGGRLFKTVHFSPTSLVESFSDDLEALVEVELAILRWVTCTRNASEDTLLVLGHILGLPAIGEVEVPINWVGSPP
ncbi:hypothetical protein HG530_009253 [Fusarium avenaceum]|nr:hypothetical protein HG530_009253 [Fusarium avenaceum]